MTNFFSLEVGQGDVTYNSRRNLLGAICVGDQITYHLFKLETHSLRHGDIATLCRRSKWHRENRLSYSIYITSFR